MASKDKNYYIGLAVKKWNEVLQDTVKEIEEMGYTKADDDKWVNKNGSTIYPSELATCTYDEVVNADEVVGYYLWLHKESPLQDWKENTEGKELTEQDRKVTEILEQLCVA